MQNSEANRILFIINPVSGGKEKHDWEAGIRAYFKDKPEQIAFYLMTGKDDRISVQHHIDRFHPSIAVAVGGDGTVKMVAGLVKETPLLMGILPAGSANGMARELGIPLDINSALDVIRQGHWQAIDMIRINEEILCIHLSDVGLNAMLVRYFETSKKRGMWGYGKALLRVLFEKQKMRVSLKTDTKQVQRRAYMVALANARKYGTGANINPEGNVGDGQFEVVIVRRINVFEIIKSIFTDRCFHPGRVEVLSTRSAEISVHRKAYFQVDGEYLGRITALSARILPGIIKVLVPKPAE